MRIAQASSPAPDLTGFRLMALGAISLDARVELARRATDSLDVQYYLIQDDRTGRFLLRTLRDASLRGVRVRLLVDDLYTAGNDALFVELAAFPNVEVRLFNPFCCARGNIATKFLASLADFRRVNHRMHNKLFIADGTLAVMGGRNIADEYFARSRAFNFLDMDVLVAGAMVPQLERIFDAYWNSPQAYPVDVVVGAPMDGASARRQFDHRVDEGDQMTAVNLPRDDMLGHSPVTTELDAGRLNLAWGRAVAFADHPAKVTATSEEASRAMSVQMSIMDRVIVSKRDVVISSPYFVPGTAGVEAFAELRKRAVEVTVLTNSLAANDVPLVHTGYARYRVDLLRSGVHLYELSPSRPDRDDAVAFPGASVGRLHAKTAVIDHRTVYIGSMNLDPRSEGENTELGMLAECPELASDVIRVLDMSRQRSSYRLTLAPDGEGLEWRTPADRGDRVLSQEPEVTPLMRLQTLLIAPFVPEQLL